MSENKTCKQCNQKFNIDPEDLKFYDKISPTFAGKKYQIPLPTLCPDCRSQRRLATRNEAKLYQRKCSATQKDIVSLYSPDKPYKVYDLEYWWSDDWDIMQYGRDFDFDQPFFKQFNELISATPHPTFYNTNTENSEYCNQSLVLNNCYLVFASRESENVMYSNNITKCRDSLDILESSNLENCYQCSKCFDCFNVQYCLNATNCSNSVFLYDCIGCHNCLGCTNLRNKRYYIFNTEYSKEEYENKIKQFNLGSDMSVSVLKKKFRELVKKAIHKYANIQNSENCTGDDIYSSKNCKSCYNAQIDGENCKYLGWGLLGFKECYDVYAAAKGSESCLECVGCVTNNSCMYCNVVYNSHNVLYSYNCNVCKDCFGCSSLRHKQYCIFNKQYSKEEYEKIVVKIIEHMRETREWGEFFPIEMSLFGYNETVANEYFPLNKEEAKKLGADWQDNEFNQKYEGNIYEPKDDINEYIKSPEEVDKLMAGILKCEVSGRPFKILPQEMSFYLKNKIAIPRLHFDERYKERFAFKNPRHLWHRNCMCEESGHDHDGKCKVEFETTYDPNRTEKVYCESCYQKSIM